ncbi:MAG: rhomboid family intramembrane serine protease [Gemmatimonadota bacterium]
MTPWTGRLILANVLIFVASIALPALWPELVLVPALLLLRPWTAVTYMFLHAGFMHILFNMIALYFFGPRVEQRLGGRHFLWLYFVSGISGALLSLLFTPYARIVGASGAVFGVLLAFAMYWPRERIYIWAVLPIEARWLVGIMTALSLYGGFSGQASGVANFAHLGGFLGGYLYLKWREWRSPARRFKRQVAGPAARASERELMRKWERIDPARLHEANRAAYEEIARKLPAGGISGLTERERAFIERFSPG